MDAMPSGPPAPLPASRTNLQVRPREPDAARDHLDVALLHVALLDATRLARRREPLLLDDLAQGLDVASEEAGLAAHHLEAVLVARRCGCR